MKNRLFWLINIIIFVIFYKLIGLSFNLSGKIFILQFFALLILLVLAIPALMGKKASVFFYSLSLLNLLFLYFMHENRFMFIAMPTALVILAWIMNPSQDDDEEESEIEPIQEEEAPQTEVLLEQYEAKHEPGKYVASKFGKTYHAPKCVWAKKIKKKSRVWFNSKEEAKTNGYKAHSCL